MPMVTYRGSQADLFDTSWEVPNEIILAGNAAQWIEDESALQQEAKEREACLAEEARQEAKRRMRHSEAEGLRADIEVLLERLEVVETQLVTDPPDMALAAQASANTAMAIDRHHRLAEEAMQLTIKIEEPIQQATALASSAQSTLHEAELLRGQSLAVAKNAGDMAGAAIESLTPVISRLKTQVNELEVRVGDLNAGASRSRETVAMAVSITDSAVDIARQTAQAEVDSMWNQFVASANALLRACGVTRSAFLQMLNAGQVQGKDAVVATRAELAAYVALSTSFAETEADADARTDEASAASTLGRIASGG